MKKILSLILVVAMIAAMGIVTASAEAFGPHTSFDLCYLSSSTANAMPVSGAGEDSFGDITSRITASDTHLVFFGWHCSNSEIGAMGYSINGGDIVWAGQVGPTEQPVKDAGASVPGTVDTERFTVSVPLTGGDNTVQIYCQNDLGTYVFWTATYTCNKNFDVLKEINFDDQSDMADFSDTTGAPLMNDNNFASFISANYKTENGALTIKNYSDIRWWGLSLVSAKAYLAAEFDVNIDTITSSVYFSVNDANDTSGVTSNQGDGGKVIVITPSETDGVYNVCDNAGTVITTINAGETHMLSAIMEVGTQNYYIGIDGSYYNYVCTYPVTFTAVGGMRLDMAPTETTQTATFDNIIVSSAELSDYTELEYTEPSVPGGDLDEYEISDVLLQLGENQLTLIDTAVTTIYEFCPEESGLYKFTANDESALVGYWGAGSFYVFDQTENKTNVLESNVAEVGPSIMVGISGVSEVTLTVERIGDAILPPEIDEIIYENQAELDEFTGVEDELTYVDVVGEEHTAVLGEDGFYHLDTEDGPILYANIKGGSEYGQSLVEAMGFGQVNYYPDENTKVDFIEAIAEYEAVADENGFYPLTVDLVEMFQKLGAAKGWYDANVQGFYIFGEEEVNAESAWLFSCAYVADEELPETDVPETDVPETDVPETDVPETDVPETDVPETDAPETEAPETDVPETDVPETEAPETETPDVEVPETGDNGVMTFAVIAMMAAAAFVATVILKKRAR